MTNELQGPACLHTNPNPFHPSLGVRVTCHPCSAFYLGSRIQTQLSCLHDRNCTKGVISLALETMFKERKKRSIKNRVEARDVKEKSHIHTHINIWIEVKRFSDCSPCCPQSPTHTSKGPESQAQATVPNKSVVT